MVLWGRGKERRAFSQFHLALVRPRERAFRANGRSGEAVQGQEETQRQQDGQKEKQRAPPNSLSASMIDALLPGTIKYVSLIVGGTFPFPVAFPFAFPFAAASLASEPALALPLVPLAPAERVATVHVRPVFARAKDSVMCGCLGACGA